MYSCQYFTKISKKTKPKQTICVFQNKDLQLLPYVHKLPLLNTSSLIFQHLTVSVDI